jgi:hypothetical protein
LIYNLDAFHHEKLLYGLTRSLFLFHDNAQVLDEVITASVLLLYNGWLKVQDLNLTLPTFLVNNLDFPVKVNEEEVVFEDTIESGKVPESAFGLLKTYWNLAWFGGIHVLLQWKIPKGDPNFSPKLFLDTSELTVIKNSFSQAILEQLSVNLNKSKTHNDFQEGLQLAG